MSLRNITSCNLRINMKTNKQQWDILVKYFPKELKIKNCPVGEGYVIPHWNLFGTYNQAVMKVMDTLKNSRRCYDWKDGNWSDKYLKQTQKKQHMWANVSDIIVLDCQLGEKYKGKSVSDARDMFTPNEIGLGIYECIIILLTHPERFSKSDDLWIDCAGDEYSWDADGVFSRAPNLDFYGDRVGFGAKDLSSASRYYGTASGFVPQTLSTCSLEPSEILTLDVAIALCKKNGLKVIRIKTIEEEL